MGWGGRIDTAIEINQDCVIVDNIWIWKADHGPVYKDTQAMVKKGLVVNGAGVVVYAAFVEHVAGEHIEWNGNDELLYFKDGGATSEQIFPSNTAPSTITADSFQAW